MFSAKEIVEILETPLGIRDYALSSKKVQLNRKKILKRYEELRTQMSFQEASKTSRIEWVSKNIEKEK